MDLETALKVGDVCLDCQHQGIEKHLRYFKLNLKGDTLLKCESNECMYPYNDAISSSDEDEEFLGNEDTTGFKLIDDLFQQINDTKVEENSSGVKLIEDLLQQNNQEPAVEFEISFLNALEDEFKSENISTLTSTQNDTQTNYFVDKKVLHNAESIADKSSINTFKEQKSLPLLNDTKALNQTAKNSNNDFLNTFKEHILSLPSLDCDKSLLKPKIQIQSIKTIKAEPVIDSLPSTSSKATSLSKLSIKEITHINQSIPLSTTASSLKSNSKLFNLSKYTTSGSTDVCSKSIISQKSTAATLESASPTSNVLSNDIPKANIISGREFLKQLKILDEKEKIINTRGRPRKPKKLIKIKNNIKIKKEPIIDDSDNTQNSFKSSDDSLDVITKFLQNIKKENNKKELDKSVEIKK